jgi:hypothetical protein
MGAGDGCQLGIMCNWFAAYILKLGIKARIRRLTSNQRADLLV